MMWIIWPKMFTYINFYIIFTNDSSAQIDCTNCSFNYPAFELLFMKISDVSKEIHVILQFFQIWSYSFIPIFQIRMKE